MLTDKGQSLLELVVVIAVGLLVISALTFATISSLRNSQLAKNQAQATKLAQEGIEKVRIARDRDDTIVGVGFSTFRDIWNTTFSCTSPINCYFKLNSSSQLQQAASATDVETFTGDLTPFQRQIIIEEVTSIDPADRDMEKRFTALVKWTDFAGVHESRQSTTLIQQ